MDDLVKLMIDGEEVQVPKGTTVLQAAEEAGFFIPTLCSDADLKPYGACRLCVVEIEGVRGLPTACTTPVAEGMKVTTDSPTLHKVRRTAIQLIRSNHPTDCDACPRNQQCDLQMTEALLEAAKSRFQAIPKDLPVDRSNPFFAMDRNYCVLCAKCVRSCDEIRGVQAISLSDRGFTTQVSAGMGGLLVDSNCESCGECLDHCPVYALNPKETRKPSKEVETVCPYCGVGCGINLGVRGGEIVGAKGRKETVNKGSLCVKGHFGIPGFVHSPDRLTTPMIRQDGEFKKATWDEALDLVARKLGAYKKDELAVIASAKCTNEDTYVAQKFARVALGTNNIDSPSRMHMSGSVAALAHSFGIGAMTNSIEELSNSTCILAVDTDLTVTHPIVGLKVKKAVRNGAKLLVLNPRGTDLGRFASSWLRIKPGTEVALIMGMCRVIVDEGLSDSTFVKERGKDFESYAESLKAYQIAAVENITGISATEISEAARAFAKDRPSSILYGPELTQVPGGTEIVKALLDLAMLTGNVGKQSSGVNPLLAQNNAQGAHDVGAAPDVYPGYQLVSDASVRAKFEAAWGCALDPSKGLDVDGILAAARSRRIKAAYVIGANPVLADTDADSVRESLAALEFLVVQDIYLTDTAKMAHVVLPAATFAEKDGTFTNTERRVQRVRKAIDGVGNSKPDWWITCQLGQKMGKGGFGFDSPAKIMQEIASLSPIYGGVSYERLDNEGLEWPCPNRQSPGTPILHLDRFTASGGFLVPAWQPQEQSTDASYPLSLMLGRRLYHTETGTLSRKVGGLNILAGEDRVEVNSQDAATMEIKDGELVKVVSRNGELTARTKVTNAPAKGTAFMAFPFASGPNGLLKGDGPYTVRIEKK